MVEITMPSLNMIGHMIAITVIAALLKQIIELNSQMVQLQTEIDILRKSSDRTAAVNNAQHTVQDTADSQYSPSSNTDTEDTHGNIKTDVGVRTQAQSIDHRKQSEGNAAKLVSVDNDSTHTKIVSSIWCQGGSQGLCRVNNVCYNSEVDEFVVLLDEESVLEGAVRVAGAVTLDLSSIHNHNNRQLTIASLPSHKFTHITPHWINVTTLMYQRFLPDNTMHMFHDDLIPMHHTLKLINILSNHSLLRPFHVYLFLYEDQMEEEDDVEQFYAMFSTRKPMWKQDFSNNQWTCFRDLYVGLSKTPTWYDYGFYKSQGPIENSVVSSLHIRSTAEFILYQLGIKRKQTDSSEYIIVFNRKENRKIINVADLTFGIVKSTGLKVMNLDLVSFSLVELISYVHNSRGIVGMHGSLMILLMFLQPGTFVVELFPYAINPDHYTPYKTLCNIPDMQISYRSWANGIKENSVTHPDWSAELGGINHLPQQQREVIMSETEVPPHACCSDPSWLYHIYQDTIVSTQEVLELVNSAMAETETRHKYSVGNNTAGDKDVQMTTTTGMKTAQSEFYQYFPSKVQNVSCVRCCRDDVCDLSVKWNHPWTLYYLNYNHVHYEILVPDKSSIVDDWITYTSSDHHLQVSITSIESQVNSQYFVWVRCIADDNIQGPYSNAVECRVKC